mmetsp:Transcript_103376/g.277697  ORF Transcript_103376/g.277697 Transcript_103376/m.277697 type:complete len:203 (-) Transcript_103376:188-796(-)
MQTHWHSESPDYKYQLHRWSSVFVRINPAGGMLRIRVQAFDVCERVVSDDVLPPPFCGRRDQKTQKCQEFVDPCSRRKRTMGGIVESMKRRQGSDDRQQQQTKPLSAQPRQKHNDECHPKHNHKAPLCSWSFHGFSHGDTLGRGLGTEVFTHPHSNFLCEWRRGNKRVLIECCCKSPICANLFEKVREIIHEADCAQPNPLC